MLKHLALGLDSRSMEMSFKFRFFNTFIRKSTTHLITLTLAFAEFVDRTFEVCF